MRTKNKAFTLIELLVVISIISVLIAILLPALAKARETAIQLQCLSNIRQCSFAFITYASDNDDELPTERHSNRIPTNWGYGLSRPGVNFMPNYLYSWEMADCPKNTLRTAASDTGNNGRVMSEYAYMGGLSTSWYHLPPRELTDPQASRRALLGDKNFERGATTDLPNHTDGSNWVMLDGHGKWFNYEYLGYKNPANAFQLWYSIYPLADAL